MPPQYKQGDCKVVDDHLLLIYGVSGSKVNIEKRMGARF